MFPTDIVIVAGARTPMARYTGSFSDVSAIDLAAHASKEAIRRSGADPAEIDHAIFGNVMQTSADALYGARHVGLKAGLRTETPAVTVNRLCGSGIEAIAQGAQRLLLGEAQMVLAGGMENMTQAPFVIRGARSGLKLGGGALEDSLMAGLIDSYCGLPMALTAEKLAEQQGNPGKIAALLQEGRHRHRRKRQRHRRWRRGGRRDTRANRERTRPDANRSHYFLGRRRRRPQHHGHRPGALLAKSAEARGPHSSTNGSCRSQ